MVPLHNFGSARSASGRILEAIGRILKSTVNVHQS
jgi:hypothetical protein